MIILSIYNQQVAQHQLPGKTEAQWNNYYFGSRLCYEVE